MQKVTKISRKLILLGAMLCALAFINYSDDLTAPVGSAPCCTDCAVYPGDDEITYCENYCGATSGTCVDNCRNRIYSCWRWCNFGC